MNRLTLLVLLACSIAAMAAPAAAEGGSVMEGDLGYEHDPAPDLEQFERELAARPGDAGLLARYAFALERSGRSDEAKRTALEAEAAAPDDPLVKLWIARMHDAGKRWQDAALAALAAASSPLATDEDRAEALFIAGTARARLGGLTEAIRLLRKATEIDPWHAQALMNLGLALRSAGRSGEGLSALMLAAKRGHDDAWLLQRVADVFDAIGRLDLALPVRRRIAELRPGDPVAHRKLGSALIAKRDIEAALSELRRAAELDPKDSRTRRTLAQLLLTEGQDEEAVRWAKEAIALGDEGARGIVETARRRAAETSGAR